MSTYYGDTVAADNPFYQDSLLGLGITVPGPTADSGDTGQKLDGVDDYKATTIYSNPGWSSGDQGPFSVEFWVKPGSAQGACFGAWAQTSVPGGVMDFEIDCMADGRILASWGDADSSFSSVESRPNNAGDWAYVVVSYDDVNRQFSLYVNGVLIQSSTATFAPTGLSIFCIGASGVGIPSGMNPPINFFNGSMADVAFYNYALPIDRVVAHYAARDGVPAYPDSSTYTGDYWRVVMEDTPLAFYRMDETAGAKAIDRSGNGHDGVICAGAHTLNEPGAIYDGNAAELLNEPYTGGWDSTPAGIATPLVSSSPTTQFSLECWLFLTSLPTASDAVIAATCGVNPGIDGYGIRFSVNSAGQLEALLTVGSTPALISPAALPSGQWNHVVFTYDGVNMTLYVNGAPVVTQGCPPENNSWVNNLTWGFNPDNYVPQICQLEATLDECAFYQFALSATRVYIHYIAGLGPLTPPPTPYPKGDRGHYWEIEVYDKHGNLIDLPKADIESGSFTDTLNGGSATSSLTFVRDFNKIGAIEYLYRVVMRVWNGTQARPANPTWAGYMVDIDQEKTRTLGKITAHLEGDQTLLDRAVVYEIVNPLVSGNPPLDAADYVRHLYETYAPPGAFLLSCPPTLFPLLPGQYQMMKLGQVIDTVLKTGRDDLGNLITWRVNSDANLIRTLLVQPDQNPNTVGGVKFKHILCDGMAAKYTIKTKYSEITNVVTVQGGQDYITGQPVIGSYIDPDSMVEFGPWQDIISVWQLISQDAANAYAQAYLDIHANPQAQGEIELMDPDPSILSGVWVQAWENSTTIKQMRVANVRFELGRSRVKQTLQPVAPTPYLDYAVYRMGMGAANNGVNLVRSLPVNTQMNYVMLGGAAAVI